MNQEAILENFHQRNKNTLAEHLGISYTAIGEDYLEGKMPVDHRTIQPLGLLHGGASAAFAETLGSLAANHFVDQNLYYCVGLEINANHIRSAKSGYVYGRATALHLGKSTQVWEIKITNETQQLVCISRLTMAVIQKK